MHPEYSSKKIVAGRESEIGWTHFNCHYRFQISEKPIKILNRKKKNAVTHYHVQVFGSEEVLETNVRHCGHVCDASPRRARCSGGQTDGRTDRCTGPAVLSATQRDKAMRAVSVRD